MVPVNVFWIYKSKALLKQGFLNLILSSALPESSSSGIISARFSLSTPNRFERYISFTVPDSFHQVNGGLRSINTLKLLKTFPIRHDFLCFYTNLSSMLEEKERLPMTVDEINVLTKRARALPPSGDQEHVLIEDGEDPWVVAHEDDLYYCTVDRTKRKILISKFGDLKEMAKAELIQIWPEDPLPAPQFLEIWSPELQMIDGRWYIYFALYNGQTGGERIWVLEATTNDPQGEYRCMGSLKTEPDRWAIDGSVLVMPNNEKYFIWSGWEGHVNSNQNLYIARMSNPWTLDSERVCISKPEYEWEKQGYPYVNEGPQALVRNGTVFIIYSASGSWTDHYCLGQLTYTGGDPLHPESWRKEPAPVFAKTNTIFGPGHGSFVNHKDQDYIIYHAARSSNAGWARQIRIKEFGWKPDGSPDFGTPK